MKMHIRPDPSSEINPDAEGLTQLQLSPQQQNFLSYNYPSSIDEIVALRDSYFLDEPGNYKQTSTTCNPRNFWERLSCRNSTTIQRCTASGQYKYTNCRSGWRCVNGIGRCLRRLVNNQFTCPEFPGVYPDPHNCRAYHICDANKVDTEVTCYAQQVYDPILQSCQRKTADRPCYRFKCRGGSGQVAYPGDANVYGTCSRNNRVDSLSRCAIGSGWSNINQACTTPYCREEGNIANPTNSSQYYVCSRIRNELVMSDVFNCTGTTFFNATVGICTPPVTAGTVALATNLIAEPDTESEDTEEDMRRAANDEEPTSDEFDFSGQPAAAPWQNVYQQPMFSGQNYEQAMNSYEPYPQRFGFPSRLRPYF